MSRRIDANTDRAELAAIVFAALDTQGIDSVLVGGAVAAIYSKGKYLTDDLDFVSHGRLKVIGPIMEQLGFRMIGNRAVHPETDLYVQFCAPPLAVGRSPVKPVQLKTMYGMVEVLSPTDCVLDRLMKFYHWDDEQGLEQALLVARSQKIDLEKVRQLSTREGKLAEFAEFALRLQAKPPRKKRK